MQKLNTISLALASAFICALSLSACNNGEVSYQSGGMKHTSQAADGSIPDDLKNLIYPDSTTSGVQTAQEEGKDSSDYSKYLQLSSTDSIEKCSQWYEQVLKKEGWNIEKNEQQSKTICIEGRMKEAEINVTLADEAGKTTIIVSKSASSGAIPDEESVENYKPSKEVTPTD